MKDDSENPLGEENKKRRKVIKLSKNSIRSYSGGNHKHSVANNYRVRPGEHGLLRCRLKGFFFPIARKTNFRTKTFFNILGERQPE